MTVEQQMKPHIVLGALDLKIEAAEQRITSTRSRRSDEREALKLVEEKIEILMKERKRLQSKIDTNPRFVSDEERKLEKLKDLRVQCEQNEMIAEAVWVKLLIERKPKKK